MQPLEPPDPSTTPVQPSSIVRPAAITEQQFSGSNRPGSAGVVTDQREVGGALLALAWIAAVVTVGYMLPWAIAATRGRSNQAAIGVIDLLLGWTVIGWIVALVMACQAHQVVSHGAHPTVVVAQNFAPTGPPPAGWYPNPSGSGQRYWDGAAWTEHFAP